MDVFRKFRSRRRSSKGHAESFGSVTDAETEHRSSTSTWRDGMDSMPRRARLQNLPITVESTHPTSRTASPANSRRPGSSGRVQPVFVGISRPDGTTSRPGTAGSTQFAFNRATDLTSTTPTRNAAFLGTQMSTKPLRYVDIFAITGISNKPSLTYNEDVAQRNLAKVTLSEQERQFSNKPPSRNYREGTRRNMSPIDVEHSFSVRSDAAGNTTLATSNEGLGLLGSWRDHNLSSPSRVVRLTPEPLAYHSRLHPVRVTDDEQHPLFKAQERPTEEELHAMRMRITEAEREMEAARQKWLDAKRLNTYDYQSSGDEKPTSERVNSPEVGVTRHSHLTSTHAYSPAASASQQTRDDSVARDSAGHNQVDYQLSSGELNDKLNPLVKINSQQRFSDSSRRYQPSRTSSNFSTASGKRKLVVGNRMIMDLTEDDADLQSVLSYRESPVIQQATSGAFQKVRPEVVETQSPVYGPDAELNEAVPNKRWSSALEPVLNMDQLTRRSQIQPIPISLEDQPLMPTPQFLYPVKPTTPPTKNFGFSAVSTVTSTSPRASQAAPVVVHTEVSQSQTEVDVPTHVPVRKDYILPPYVTAGSETNAQKPVPMASRVSIVADVAPEDTESTASSTSDKTTTARTIFAKAQARLQQDNLSLRREVAERGIARQPAVQAARQSSQEGSRTVPRVAPVPEQEVKTRDFALMPSRKPSTEKSRASRHSKRTDKMQQQQQQQQQQTEAQKTIADIINPPPAQGSGKPRSTKSSSNSERSATRSTSKGKRPAKQNSSATRKTRPISIFDEDAFKRKQADANAALMKLQMSLNEALPAIEPELQSTLLIRSRTVPVMPSAEPATTSTESVSTGILPTRSVSTKSRPQPIMTETSSTADSGAAAAAAAILPDRRGVRSPSSNPFMSHSRTSLPKNTMTPLNSYLTNPGATAQREQQQQQQPSQEQRQRQQQPPPTPPPPPPPRSPGEISLSSFPIPTPRAMSPEITKPTFTSNNNTNANSARNSMSPSNELARRDSQKSRVSTASTYSIPFSMVPGRNSSLQQQQQQQQNQQQGQNSNQNQHQSHSQS